MGGVFCSVLWIQDENGNSHASGKGKLGAGGIGMLMHASVGSAIVWRLAQGSGFPNWGIAACLALGFTVGAAIGQRPEKVSKKKSK